MLIEIKLLFLLAQDHCA